MVSTRIFLSLCLISSVSADLRIGTHPRNGYNLHEWGGKLAEPAAENRQTGAKCDPTSDASGATCKANVHMRYMIPSVFSYTGLKYPGGQKYNNYDNFLRSNIDNEQDNRNFDDEVGYDHLPFRTIETAIDRSFATNRYDGQRPRPKDLRVTVLPGESLIVPLRWNNPHAGEMEVNVWIFEHGGDKGGPETHARAGTTYGQSKDKRPMPKPIVIPIRKPTCSAEGHQNMAIAFTIPKDFNELGKKIPGFKGCNDYPATKNMCVLQIYSHSVESRQYATAFPIRIPGNIEAAEGEVVSQAGIGAQKVDPWLDIGGLRDVCRPSTDDDVHIANAVPRWATMVSDVYTHSYMNSDFSPYSGQQHEYISKNLQSSAINKMVTGNRGELGASILTQEQSQRLAQLQSLEDTIYKNYESIANKIIKNLGNEMANTGSLKGANPNDVKQQLATCFRCAEVGATIGRRLDTNTYIPSFQLPDSLVARARSMVPSKYSSLINGNGMVQIYHATLIDLMPFFFVSNPLGITYQPGYVKDTLTSSGCLSRFKKRDAAGNKDGGVYASTVAKNAYAERIGCPAKCLYCEAGMKPLFKGSKATCVTQECSNCMQLFDDYTTKASPHISPLAAQVAKGGLPKGMGLDQIVSYPDTDGSPRFGRLPSQGEKAIKPTNSSWDLKKPAPPVTQPPTQPPTTAAPTEPPTTMAPTTEAPPAPAPTPKTTRRRRRSSPRRRRKGKGGNRDKKPTRRRRGGQRRRRRKAASLSQKKALTGMEAVLESVLGDVERLPTSDGCK